MLAFSMRGTPSGASQTRARVAVAANQPPSAAAPSPKQQALGQDLADQSIAAGTECSAYTELLLAIERSANQHGGDITAGNEQQHECSQGEHEERSSDVARLIAQSRNDIERVGFVARGRHDGQNAGEPRHCLLGCNSICKPAKRDVLVVSPILALDRKPPRLRSVTGNGGDHSNDGVDVVAELDTATDDIGICSKPLTPERFVQHRPQRIALRIPFVK
jgi:hypothetical protein